jgi:nicotinate-nucleotide adenylyltransferase
MKNRIGIIGGTFNPVHQGHIELGLRTHKHFQFQRIFYILSAHPPHKPETLVADTNLRWNMLKAALAPYPFLVPCDIEMKRHELSWTYKTIAELKKSLPDSQLFFISGSEGFLKITTWVEYKKILNEIPFIIVLRNQDDANEINALLDLENIAVAENCDSITKLPGAVLYRYDSKYLMISSTQVRDKLKNRQSVADDLQPEVKKIVEENKLYGCQ